MKFTPVDPPREFRAGAGDGVIIRDCGRLELDTNEQITVITAAGGEWDIARKKWGFYATPSLNRRLLQSGLRALLAGNEAGDRFLWLVERGREAEMETYVQGERQRVIGWLDEPGVEIALRARADNSDGVPRCPSGIEDWTRAFLYEAPPSGETRFPIAGGRYRREVLRSRVTGHFVSRHDMDLEKFYEKEYVDSTYGDAVGMRKSFERIMNLSAGQSDNAGRVKWVTEVCLSSRGAAAESSRILDVGSGLAVFSAAMAAAGWKCDALDPDNRAAAWASSLPGVRGIHADFANFVSNEKYSLLTFNKVLEHIVEPIGFLARARGSLTEHGAAYIEVPDGTAASIVGADREEFFIEHHHVYSVASLTMTAEMAGFRVERLERLREPSGKFTIRALLTYIAAKIIR